MPRHRTETLDVFLPGWAVDAACARPGNREIFQRLTERAAGRDGATARFICRTCPVLPQCRDYARQMRPTAGVWAGLNYGRTDRWGPR